MHSRECAANPYLLARDDRRIGSTAPACPGVPGANPEALSCLIPSRELQLLIDLVDPPGIENALLNLVLIPVQRARRRTSQDSTLFIENAAVTRTEETARLGTPPHRASH